MLELLAFFASDSLPIEVLASASEKLPEGLDDELARDEAIAALHRFSLLRAEADTLTVHRLVQAVTRDGLDPATAQAHAEAAVRLVKAALPPPWEPTNWPAIGVLLPHALATAEAAERLETGLETTGTVLIEAAIYHHTRAVHAQAERLYERALAIQEKALGPEHRDVARSLQDLALLYNDTGRLAEAEPLHQRALNIREKVLGPEHPDVAWSLQDLAWLYQTRGRYSQGCSMLLDSVIRQ